MLSITRYIHYVIQPPSIAVLVLFVIYAWSANYLAMSGYYENQALAEVWGKQMAAQPGVTPLAMSHLWRVEVTLVQPSDVRRAGANDTVANLVDRLWWRYTSGDVLIIYYTSELIDKTADTRMYWPVELVITSLQASGRWRLVLPLFQGPSPCLRDCGPPQYDWKTKEPERIGYGWLHYTVSTHILPVSHLMSFPNDDVLVDPAVNVLVVHHLDFGTISEKERKALDSFRGTDHKGGSTILVVVFQTNPRQMLVSRDNASSTLHDEMDTAEISMIHDIALCMMQQRNASLVVFLTMDNESRDVELANSSPSSLKKRLRWISSPWNILLEVLPLESGPLVVVTQD